MFLVFEKPKTYVLMFGCAETYVSGVRETQNICFACLDVLKHVFLVFVNPKHMFGMFGFAETYVSVREAQNNRIWRDVKLWVCQHLWMR